MKTAHAPRIGRRLAGVALFFAIFAGATSLPTMAATPLDQPLAGYASIVSPTVRQITAGTTGTLALRVRSLGPLPINWVAISPSSTLSLVSATGPAWTSSLTGNRVVFGGGAINPSAWSDFSLQVRGVTTSGATPSADTLVPFTIEVSHDGGAHKRLFTAPPDDTAGLDLAVKVLRVLDGPKIVAPAQAADGTATAGQDNLKVAATIKNFGGAALTPTAVLKADNGTIAASSVPVELAAGESKQVVYDVVAGAAGALNFSLDVKSVTPAAAAAATSAPSTLQAAPTIVCTAVTAGGDDKIFNPAYGVTFDKAGLPSLDVASYALSIATSPAFGPAALTTKTVGTGDLTGQRIDFAPVAVPAGTPENEYAVSLVVNAVDSNGATFAAGNVTCPKVRVDIKAPELVSAKATPIDSPLRQLRLDPDATIRVTFSEIVASGVDSAEFFVPLDANGERVSGVTVQGVEPCADAAATCRVVTVDSGFTERWTNIATLQYCPASLAAAYTDQVGNHTACGASVAVTR